MKEIYSFKDKWIELIGNKDKKIWLSEKQGRRNECLLSVGKEQFISANILYENASIIVFGQNISNELKEKLLKIGGFNE